MGYAVLHIAKNGGGALGNHIDRKASAKHSFRNADPERTRLNVSLSSPYMDKPMMEGVAMRIAEGYTKKTAIRKDAVKNLTMVLSGSHAEMKALEKAGRIEEWHQKNAAWVEENFGGMKNIVRLTLHMDEETPHIHAVVVPITADGRLSAKDFTGTAKKLEALQTSYAKAMGSFGLARGVSSERKHQSTEEYDRERNRERIKNELKKQPVKAVIKEKVKAISLNPFGFEARKNQLSDTLELAVKKETESLAEENNSLKNQLEAERSRVSRSPGSVSEKVRKWYDPAEILQRIQNTNLVDYFRSLKNLGFTHKAGPEYYFGTAEQQTGSIAVNPASGKWYDHAAQMGGNLIDAIKRFEKMSYKQAIQMLFERYIGPSKTPLFTERKDNPITYKGPVQHPALVNYLHKRGITDDIIQAQCQQIHWTTGEGKHLFAYTLKKANIENGYALRNPLLKINGGNSAPTFIEGEKGSKKAIVFEGMTDYLSHLAIQGVKEAPESIIILNGISNKTKAIGVLKRQDLREIDFYLDRGEAGEGCYKWMRNAIRSEIEGPAMVGVVITDRSELYAAKNMWDKGAKDLNEFLIQQINENSQENELKRGRGIGR